jgi:hypothetical protein
MREDVARARGAAKAILTFTAILLVVLLFLWVAAPGFSTSGMREPWYVTAMPWFGVGLHLVGLGWMIRIYRSYREPEARGWRYRS